MTAILRTRPPSPRTVRLLVVLLVVAASCQGAESANDAPGGTGVVAESGGNPDVVLPDVVVVPEGPDGAVTDQPAPAVNVYSETVAGDWSGLIDGMPELVYVPSSDSS